MSEPRRDIPLGFTGELFPEVSHMCMIFDDDKQRQKIAAEFMAIGLKGGELVRYVADSTSPEAVRSWLLELGVELPEDAPFNIFNAESFYRPNKHFDPHEMIGGMVPRFEQARRAGYSGVRSCGEMSWALRDSGDVDRMLEYEALLNTVSTTFPHIGMCQYDARLFDGATLLKVLRVHPYMVAQGQVVRNPFYVRPEEFLARSDVHP